MPVMMGFLGATLDIGLANAGRTALANAVASGAQYAALTGTSVAAANVKALVEKASGLQNVVAAVTGPTCSCIGGTSPTLSAATCGSTCADGSMAGSYVTVGATYTYSALMPVFSLMDGVQATERAVARLQ